MTNGLFYLRCKAFLYFGFVIAISWQKKIGKIAAFKMLLKLNECYRKHRTYKGRIVDFLNSLSRLSTIESQFSTFDCNINFQKSYKLNNIFEETTFGNSDPNLDI